MTQRALIGSAITPALALGAVLAAQNPPQFKAGIDVVQLDVSVYDKHHHPIKGLQASDFTLLEDKLPRPLVGFSEIDIPEPAVPTAKWMRDAVDDVATNDVSNRRLFVIVIDDLNPDLMFKQVRDQVTYAARSVIDHLGPNDLAAVLFTADKKRSQEFTSDHGRLIEAVKDPWGATVGSVGIEPLQVKVLREASEYLIGVPARRKIIVDITNYDISCLWGPQLTTVAATFEAAQRSGVVINMMRLSDTITLCAPGGGSALITTQLDAVPDAANWVTRTPRETGGEAFLNVQEPQGADAATRRIFEASGSYYLLGYTSADLKKFHFIKVLVDRAGAEVRTRDKYYWPEHEKPPKGAPPVATLAAIAGTLPKGDIPLKATVAPFAAVGGGRAGSASVAVVLNVHQVRPEGATGPIRESLDLRAATFTAIGDARGSSTRTVPVRLPAGTSDVEYEILHRIDVAKPGLYELRLSTHSSARSADGSVYVTVDVPDFSRPLSLSGIVLGSDNGLAIDGAERLKTLLPLTPTTARTFDRGEPATAFLRAYEGGAAAIRPLTVHTRIVNDHDQAVMDRTETLGPERFDRTRSTGIFVRLPTGDLAPGPYLLSLEASIGKTGAKRELRFVVK